MDGAEYLQALDAAPEPSPFGLSRGGECGDESIANFGAELKSSAKNMEKDAGVPGLEMVAVLAGAAGAGHGGICAKLNWLQPELERESEFFRGFSPPLALANERVSAALFQLQGKFGELQAAAEPAAACFVKLMAQVSPSTRRADMTRCYLLADKTLRYYPKFQEAVISFADGQIAILSQQEEFLRRLAQDPKLSPVQRTATAEAHAHIKRQKDMFLAIRLDALRQPWDSLTEIQKGVARKLPGILSAWREDFFGKLGRPRNVCLISERVYGELDLGFKIVNKQTAVAEKEWSRPEGFSVDGEKTTGDARGAGAVWGSHAVFYALWELQRLLDLIRPSAEADSQCARLSKAGSGSRAP